ncbi:unnamed protein product [Arctogadus glacialis]
MRLGDSDELYIVHSALDTSSIWTTPWLAEALFQTGVVLIGAGDTHQALLLPCSSPPQPSPQLTPNPGGGDKKDDDSRFQMENEWGGERREGLRFTVALPKQPPPHPDTIDHNDIKLSAFCVSDSVSPGRPVEFAFPIRISGPASPPAAPD